MSRLRLRVGGAKNPSLSANFDPLFSLTYGVVPVRRCNGRNFGCCGSSVSLACKACPLPRTDQRRPSPSSRSCNENFVAANYQDVAPPISGVSAMNGVTAEYSRRTSCAVSPSITIIGPPQRGRGQLLVVSSARGQGSLGQELRAQLRRRAGAPGGTRFGDCPRGVPDNARVLGEPVRRSPHITR